MGPVVKVVGMVVGRQREVSLAQMTCLSMISR